jgi:hypothetical protein
VSSSSQFTLVLLEQTHRVLGMSVAEETARVPKKINKFVLGSIDI